MNEKEQNQNGNDKLFPHLPIIVLLAILVSLIYSNSLNNSWHFDDKANILENKNVHIEQLEPNSILTSFYHWENNSLYRPVTNFSFALNWFVGRDNVAGYHLFNILVHILTTSFLYLVIIKLLQTKRLKNIYSKQAQFIAAIATALWATNPIQVQAITFIVQRATLLSALFSIICLYTYLLGREKNEPRQFIFYYFLCSLSFFLALGSKENAILLPGSLLLIEVLFLRQTPLNLRWKNKSFWILLIPILAIFLYFIISIIFQGKITLNIFDFSGRNFSLYERFFTEMRVLIFYLSQIAFPLNSRLSLEHDITLSTSLLDPWTTLPALFLVLCAVVLSILKYKKFPLLAFAVLFYFYNHIIESTILHLEIIFEHRNYLPSFFLFLPIIGYLTIFIERYSQSNKHLQSITNFFLVILLIIYGFSTYSRNLDWQTEKSLLLDSIAKAPNQARPYHNLAVYLMNKEKNFDDALSLFNIALTKQSPSKIGPKYQTLHEISKIYINHKHDYQAAIPLLREALAEMPNSLTPRKDLATSLIAVGELPEALQHIEILLDKRAIDYKLKENEKISRQYLLNLKALVLLKQNSLSPAITVAKETIILEPENPLALANLGLILSRLGKHDEAKSYLSKLYSLQNKPDLLTFFLLLENSLAAKESDMANEITQHIVTTFSLSEVFSFLTQLNKPSSMLLPIDTKLLRPFLVERFSGLGSSINFENFSLKPLFIH